MNNNRETLFQWIDEQLVLDEDLGACVELALMINPAGDSRTVFSIKSGHTKWGDVNAMTDILWTVATRTAKGVPGFCQFQVDAMFSSQANKPLRFLPFGLMGATQLGPAGGGTTFAGLATEGPTPMGQQSQNMRLTELLVQGAYGALNHVVTNMQRSNEKKDDRIDQMEKRMDEQWLALKNALLEIQNAADSRAMRLLYMEVSRKVVTLLPGLANALSGKEIFPQHIVEQSMIDTIAVNFSPEEQAGLISMVKAHPQGDLLAGVLVDQLSRAKKRREAEATELQRAMGGVGSRSYADGESDAGGEIVRVLKGQPKPLPEGKPETNGHKVETKPVEPARTDVVPGADDNDTKLIDDLLAGVPPEQLDMMVNILGQQKPGLGDRVKKRYHELKARGQ